MSAGPVLRKPQRDTSASSWTAGPRDPALAPAAIDMWRVDLAAAGVEVLAALSAEERERAARIAGARDQSLWGRSRGVLRDLLGRYLKADPASLELTLGPHGKPSLGEPWSDCRMHFNLSHSGGLALYAFASCGAVGVDVQEMREPSRRAPTDRLALATRVFGAEAAANLRALEPQSREREFLRLWTGYEAELKRRGIGIGAASAEEQADLEARAEPWIVDLDVGPRAVAALASGCDPAGELRLWEWA